VCVKAQLGEPERKAWVLRSRHARQLEAAICVGGRRGSCGGQSTLREGGGTQTGPDRGETEGGKAAGLLGVML
jgi:hypothetical protein